MIKDVRCNKCGSIFPNDEPERCICEDPLYMTEIHKCPRCSSSVSFIREVRQMSPRDWVRNADLALTATRGDAVRTDYLKKILFVSRAYVAVPLQNIQPIMY